MANQYYTCGEGDLCGRCHQEIINVMIDSYGPQADGVGDIVAASLADGTIEDLCEEFGFWPCHTDQLQGATRG